MSKKVLESVRVCRDMERMTQSWPLELNTCISKNIMAAPEGPFHSVSDGIESACDAGDPGLIPGSGRSPEEGNGNPLQYSCLENPMDGGAW